MEIFVGHLNLYKCRKQGFTEQNLNPKSNHATVVLINDLTDEEKTTSTLHRRPQVGLHLQV